MLATIMYLALCLPRETTFTVSAGEVREALVTHLMFVPILLLCDSDEPKDDLVSDIQARDTFLTSAVREVRVPLQSMLSSIELMSQGADSGKNASLLDQCQIACTVVVNVLSNILDACRIPSADAGRLAAAPSLVPADMKEVLMRVIHTVRVPVSLECEPTFPPAIEIDPQRIERLLMILASSAASFACGRVVVRLGWLPSEEFSTTDECTQQALKSSSWKQTFELADEWNAAVKHGLAKKYCVAPTASERTRRVTAVSFPSVTHLEPTQRVHTQEVIPSIPRRTSGTVKLEVMYCSKGRTDLALSPGLLHICKELAGSMRGDMRVKSKPGRGANLMVAFPAKAATEACIAGRHYMVIHAEAAEGPFVLSRLLTKYGITATECRDEARALELCRIHPNAFDGIIFISSQSQQQQQQSFISSLRRIENSARTLQQTPVLVLTSGEASVEEKHGTTAVLLQPARVRDVVSAMEKLHLNRERAFRKRPKRVLIVDPDRLAAKFMSVLLEKQGHRCVIATSMDLGLVAINERPADVVIVDTLLGDGTGMDFVRELKRIAAQEKTRFPKLISVSTSAPEEQRRLYESAGEEGHVCGYVQKPVRKHDLLRMV